MNCKNNTNTPSTKAIIIGEISIKPLLIIFGCLILRIPVKNATPFPAEIFNNCNLGNIKKIHHHIPEQMGWPLIAEWKWGQPAACHWQRKDLGHHFLPYHSMGSQESNMKQDILKLTIYEM